MLIKVVTCTLLMIHFSRLLVLLSSPSMYCLLDDLNNGIRIADGPSESISCPFLP